MAVNAGWLPPPNDSVPTIQWITYTALFALIAGISFYINQLERESLRHSKTTLVEREHAEAALIESEANFRTFFETLTDLVIVGTTDGRILYANKAVFNKLKYSMEDLALLHILDLNPADQRAQAEANFSAMIRNKLDYCPLPIVRKEGSLMPAETRIWPGRWNGQDCIYEVMKDLSAEMEAHQRFESMFRHRPAMMAVTSSPDRKFFDVNQAFIRATGYSRDELIGKTSAELSLIMSLEKVDAAAMQIRAGEQVDGLEAQVRCKDGTILDGLFWGETIRIQGREYLLTLMIDITERKRLQEELRESEETYRALFEVANDGIILFDMDMTILRANPRSAQIHGVKSPEELIGRKITDFVVPEQFDDALSRLEMLRLDQPLPPYVRTLCHVDGSVIDTELSLSIIKDRSGTPLYVQSVIRDITERKRSEEAIRKAHEELRRYVDEIEKLQAELREQSLHDPLTGLYNRRFLDHTLAREKARSDRNKAPLSILVADIGHFKHINNVNGHLMGDRFLVEVANMLIGSTRTLDFVCRYGGEEFLIVLPGASPEAARMRADEIRKKCGEITFEENGNLIGISLSFGVAIYPDHGQDVEEVIAKADKAMY